MSMFLDAVEEERFRRPPPSELTIFTPSIPERHEMLTECLESVRVQTHKARHVISVDHQIPRMAASNHINKLVRGCETRYMMLLADDDLLDPTYVERTLEAAEALSNDGKELVVVSTYCRGGEPFNGYNRPFNARTLMAESCVSGSSVMSTQLWALAGGWLLEFGPDWRFWQRCLARGALFTVIEEPLFTYRIHGRNHSRQFPYEDGIPPLETA